MCETSTATGTSVKPGLEVALGTLLKLSCKILSGDYRLRKEKERVDSIEEFHTILKTGGRPLKKKPARSCIFCGIFVPDLSRHFTLKHKQHPTIKEILNNE